MLHLTYGANSYDSKLMNGIKSQDFSSTDIAFFMIKYGVSIDIKCTETL